MVWVKSEYAGELAVVSAWLSALLPWYVSVTPDHAEFPGTVAFVRFPFLEVRYIFGFPLADAVTVSRPLQARSLVGGDVAYLESLLVAYDLWLVGATLVGIAVVLSIAMYADLERVEDALPLAPVRAMGGLLTLAGVVLAVATVLFYLRSVFGEWPIPIGLPFLLGLGVVLLRVDLVDGGSAPDGAPGETSADAPE